MYSNWASASIVGDEVAARFLRDAIEAWDADPRRVAGSKSADSNRVRARLETTAELPPAQRWAALANELDTRLVDEPDWPATATMLHQAHEAGHDIPTVTRAMVLQMPLGGSPARELRYRIVASLDLTADTGEDSQVPPTQRMPGSEEPRTNRRYPHQAPQHQGTSPYR